MKRLISVATRRPVGTIMFFLGLLAASLAGVTGMGVDFLPEVDIPRLIVAAAYPGLPAAETRLLLAIPLEDALSSAKGMKRVSSLSREGLATITLEFHWGTDMRMAAVEAREIIDLAYPALPSDAKKPLVLPVDPAEDPVMIIGLFPRDGDLALARRLGEREVRTMLQQAGGVGTVTLVGGLEEEIQVLADQESMSSRGLTAGELAQAIAAANYDYPAGTIREGDGEFLVKAKGSVDAAWKIGEFLLAGRDGSRSFKVADVADIRLETRERSSCFCRNGREGIALEIRKRQGMSPVSVSHNVRQALALAFEAYGKDLELEVESDKSTFILRAMEDLEIAVALGAAIAFLMLLLFMRDAGIALVMVASLPVSMLAALALLRLTGRTANVMSLGGLAMGLGMMVDHSVVVVENLQRRFVLEGRTAVPGKVAEFTHELSSSNVGSTLASIIVFLPVLLLPGVIGALFTDLSLAVIFSQIASFLTSITLVPVLFQLRGGARRTGRGNRTGFIAVEARFRMVSRFFFRRPRMLLATILGISCLGLVCLRLLPFEFFPEVDTGEIEATLTLPQGSTMEYAAMVALDATRRLAGASAIDRVFATVGGEDGDTYYQAGEEGGAETIKIRAMLGGSQHISAFALVPAVRSLLSAEAAELIVRLPENAASRLLGAGQDGLSFLVFGRDQAEATDKAKAFRDSLSRFAFDSVSQYPSGMRRELIMSPDRESMSRSRLDLSSLAESVRDAIEGSYPTTITSSGRELDVRVLLREGQRSSVASLDALVLRDSSGAAERLGDLARSELVSERPLLLRVDRRDALKVAVGAPCSSTQRRAAVESASIDPDICSLDESALTENLGRILATFALVILLLYLALGAQFESFGLPLVLLLALPLSLSGIFVALLVGGKSINFDSILGIIVLFGVAVNNSMILYSNFRKRSVDLAGPLLLVSIYRGSSERLRAVFMTMSATILSMLPIAFDPSRRTSQSSMAVAIIGGLLVSTTLTLFVVPMAFYRYRRGSR